MKEKELQNAILRAFGTISRFWRANTGVAQIGKRFVRFGSPGQADLTGILPDGRRLEVEVKSATGRQTRDQKSFQRMIEKFNGVYVLARSVEELRNALREHL